MTLPQFLDLTRDLPDVSVRTAMVRAITERGPAAPLDPASYAAFYLEVLQQLSRGTTSEDGAAAGPPAGDPCTAIPRASGPGPRLPLCEGSSFESLLPYRRIALRVIAQAFRDLTEAGQPAERHSALAFFSGSPMLQHWCAVASLDPSWMAARARTLAGRWPPRSTRVHTSKETTWR